MKYSPFGLRIHCWGGLGSQLFAANLAFDIQAKFPRKNVTLILHSGGVTERLPELPEIFPNFHYGVINDYAERESTEVSPISFSRSVRKLLFKAFTYFGLMATLDDDDSLSSIKYWTIAVRGHYSYRVISNQFLEKFYENLVGQGLSFEVFDSGSISLHYRLGDLLSLEEKSPIDNQRIVQVIRFIEDRIPDAHIYLHSDSPKEALLLLTKSNLDLEIFVRRQPPLQLILNCSNSEHFIGTSSKISFWIALVRSEILNRDSYLPKEKIDEFKWLSRTDTSINFY